MADGGARRQRVVYRRPAAARQPRHLVQHRAWQQTSPRRERGRVLAGQLGAGRGRDAGLEVGPRHREGPSMPRTPSLALLPPRYGRHAIARLDAVIALAEKEQAEQRQAVERSPERGAAKARLRLVEYRLGLLHGSRRLLTAG